MLTGPVPAEQLVALRLGAFVVDLALLGAHAWPYLERVSSELPCPSSSAQGTVDRRPAGARPDDWLTKPCHPEELSARLQAVARRRQSDGAPAAEEGKRTSVPAFA